MSKGTTTLRTRFFPSRRKMPDQHFDSIEELRETLEHNWRRRPEICALMLSNAEVISWADPQNVTRVPALSLLPL